MSDTGTISQEFINKLAEELATLRREREELRKALSDLMLAGEHMDLMQGMRIDALFPKRFEAARAVLAKGKP